MNRIIVLLLSILISASGLAQDRYMTRSGYIDFFSSTPIEDIHAVNKQVTSLLDLASGEIVFSVLIRSFEFEKKLMQEHFNENYLESDQFPKATFKGKIERINQLSLKEGTPVKVVVNGLMSVHGVERAVEAEGWIQPEGDQIRAQAEFDLRPEDYDIKIPRVVRENIAERVRVTVKMNYSPYS